MFAPMVCGNGQVRHGARGRPIAMRLRPAQLVTTVLEGCGSPSEPGVVCAPWWSAHRIPPGIARAVPRSACALIPQSAHTRPFVFSLSLAVNHTALGTLSPAPKASRNRLWSGLTSSSKIGDRSIPKPATAAAFYPKQASIRRSWSSEVLSTETYRDADS